MVLRFSHTRAPVSRAPNCRALLRRGIGSGEARPTSKFHACHVNEVWLILPFLSPLLPPWTDHAALPPPAALPSFFDTPPIGAPSFSAALLGLHM